MDRLAWKNLGASVLGLGLRRTFLSITEASSMKSSMENDVANSYLLMPRDMFLFKVSRIKLKGPPDNAITQRSMCS